MKTNLAIRCLLLFILVALSACQAPAALPQVTNTPAVTLPPTKTPTPQPSPTATSTVTPTEIPSPTPVVFAPVSADWKGAQIKRVCVRQEFLPGLDEGYTGQVSNQRRLYNLLAELGFEPMGETGKCDATLNIILMATPRKADYKPLDGGEKKTCIIGSDFYGMMVLNKAGLPSLDAAIIDQGITAPQISQGCPDQKDTIDTGYTKVVLEGLSEILGPTVITGLYKSADNIHQRAAYQASEALGPEALDVLPDVIEALKTNQDIETRITIAAGIQNLGPQAQEAAGIIVPEMVDRFKTEKWTAGLEYQEQLAYVTLFSEIGVGSKAAVPLLVDLFKETDNNLLTHEIIKAIENIGPSADDAVKLMIDLAKSDETHSVETLGRMGPVSPDVVPTLWGIAKDSKKYPHAWNYALRSLAGMRPQDPTIVPYLLAVCEGEDAEAAAQAIGSLDAAGLSPEQLAPLLTRLLSSPNEKMRAAAIEQVKILGPSLGPGVKDLIPALIQSSKTRRANSVEDVLAIDALSVIAKGDPQVTAAIQDKLTRDKSLDEFTLDQLGPESREVAPELINTLKYLQKGGRPIMGIGQYIRALVRVTGAYPGYMADDWQKWLDGQK